MIGRHMSKEDAEIERADAHRSRRIVDIDAAQLSHGFVDHADLGAVAMGNGELIIRFYHSIWIGIQKEKTEPLPGPSLAEGIKSLIFQSFFAIMLKDI